MKKNYRYFLLSIILLFSHSSFGSLKNIPTVSPALMSDLDQNIPLMMKTFDVPGAAIAIIQNNKIVYLKAFGIRNLKTQAPFTVNTIYRIGSVSKSMTSMYVAKKIDQKLFSWDTPIHHFFPAFRLPTKKLNKEITVRQIMNMATGLGENPIELYFDLDTPSYFFNKLTQLPILTAPHYFHYNNSVYALSGYFKALKIGIKPKDLLNYFQEEMKTELFYPMEMKSSAITDNPYTINTNYAISYGYDLLQGISPTYPLPFEQIEMIAPAGSVSTTIKDMANYLLTQINHGIGPNGKRVVSESSLAETWRTSIKADKELSWTHTAKFNNPFYGMGWFSDTVEGIPVRYHDGSADAFKTNITIFPDANIGFVIFTNSESGSALIWSLRSYLFEKLYRYTPNAFILASEVYQKQKMQYQNLRESISLKSIPKSTISSYLGKYEKGWQVIYRNKHLWLTRADHYQLILLPTQKQTYLIGSGNTTSGFGMEIKFIKNANGKIRMNILSHQKRIDSLLKL